MGDCAGLLLSYFSIISLPTSSDFSGQRDKGLRSRKDHVRVEQLEEEEMRVAVLQQRCQERAGPPRSSHWPYRTMPLSVGFHTRNAICPVK